MLPRLAATRLLKVANRRLCRRFEPYLAARFRPVIGYQPDIAWPRRYHEKMMWRKIFDRNPLFVTFCDKLATKAYQAERAPDLAIPETLWVGTDIREIPNHVLQERVVIKASHGCSCNFSWEPGRSDLCEVEARAAAWMNYVHGQGDYEWAYGGVVKRIFVERYIGTPGSSRPVDLSIRCTDGRPILASVKTDTKTPAQKIGYFSPDGDRVFMEQGSGLGSDWGLLPADHAPPCCLGRAVEAAARLSRGVDYARYDFMTDGRNLYAGEIVVYPNSGMTKAGDERNATINTLVAAHWDLRKSWFLSHPQPGRLGLYARILRSALSELDYKPDGR
jgi:hypothetical protein